jgi:hypothetical protein
LHLTFWVEIDKLAILEFGLGQAGTTELLAAAHSGLITHDTMPGQACSQARLLFACETWCEMTQLKKRFSNHDCAVAPLACCVLPLRRLHRGYFGGQPAELIADMSAASSAN